ncbi:hypothetical protein E4U26_006144 [Claviceps purpurea]|nr:hypothetical protein E4U26_006144 [Claviceps purpurea]
MVNARTFPEQRQRRGALSSSWRMVSTEDRLQRLSSRNGSIVPRAVPDSQYGTELTRFDDAALQGLATIVRLENLRLADVVFSRISY